MLDSKQVSAHAVKVMLDAKQVSAHTVKVMLDAKQVSAHAVKVMLDANWVRSVPSIPSQLKPGNFGVGPTNNFFQKLG